MRKCLLFLLLFFILGPGHCHEQITLFVGPKILSYLPEIKKMRGTYFRHYPYLYCSAGPETEDTSYYEASQETVLLVAHQQEKVIGLIIGLPLQDFKFQKDFLGAHKKISLDLGQQLGSYFYISELMIAEGFCGKGLEEKLLHHLEDYVYRRYPAIAVMTIERDANHPMRPPTYKPESALYTRNCYHDTGLTYGFSWPVLQPDNSVKIQKDFMRLWIKDKGDIALQ